MLLLLSMSEKMTRNLFFNYLSSCRSCIPCILALSAVFTYYVIKVFPGLDCCTLISLSDSSLSLLPTSSSPSVMCVFTQFLCYLCRFSLPSHRIPILPTAFGWAIFASAFIFTLFFYLYLKKSYFLPLFARTPYLICF